MKPIFCAISFCLLFPLLALAQSNYLAGYVVKNTGDTVKGFINYREWNKSPSTIEFKNDKNDNKPVVFNTSAIKGFGVPGFDKYIAYNGPVSTSIIGGTDLSPVLDTAVRQDSVFMKLITTGPNVSLFYLKDNNRYSYFIAEGDAQPQELKFYQYIDDNKIISFAPYIHQLNVLARKYQPASGNVASGIREDTYSEGEILKVVRIINNNVSSEEHHSSVVRFFIGAAAAYNIGIFTGPSQFNYSSTAASLFPSLNLGVDIIGNAAIQKSFFRLQASVTNTSTTFNSPIAYYSLKETVIRVGGQYIANLYNTDKLKYFVGIGGAFDVYLVGEDKLTAEKSGIIISPVAIQNLGDSAESLNAGQSINAPYELNRVGFDFVVSTGLVLNKAVEIFIEAEPYSVASMSQKPANEANNPLDPSSYQTAYRNATVAAGVKFLFGTK